MAPPGGAQRGQGYQQGLNCPAIPCGSAGAKWARKLSPAGAHTRATQKFGPRKGSNA
jgi:hypothetical protein